MHPLLRENALKIIKLNTVKLIPTPFGDSFRVYDSKNQLLLRAETDPKQNRYYVVTSDDRKKLGDIKWRDTDAHVSRDQQDVLDIIATCRKKIQEQDKDKATIDKMTIEEKEIYALLNSMLAKQI